MELWKDMLIGAIQNQSHSLSEPTKLLELECYIALSRIKSVLEDNPLTDVYCFEKIEEIISVYEEMGVKIYSRHDF